MSSIADRHRYPLAGLCRMVSVAHSRWNSVPFVDVALASPTRDRPLGRSAWLGRV